VTVCDVNHSWSVNNVTVTVCDVNHSWSVNNVTAINTN